MARVREKDTAEIFVMGVLPGQHRRGIGKELYLAFEWYAKEKGYSFVQVKTVQSGHYKEYDRTNAFYRAMGFLELECLLYKNVSSKEEILCLKFAPSVEMVNGISRFPRIKCPLPVRYAVLRGKTSRSRCLY